MEHGAVDLLSVLAHGALCHSTRIQTEKPIVSIVLTKAIHSELKLLGAGVILAELGAGKKAEVVGLGLMAHQTVVGGADRVLVGVGAVSAGKAI
jgi:hypothetical protein